MIWVVLVLLLVDLAVMVGWIHVNHKTLQTHHARHAERVHQTIMSKCLALQKDSKLSHLRSTQSERRLDEMLIEMRQEFERGRS